MPQGSLLPYLRDASLHAGSLLGAEGEDLFDAARLRAARELTHLAAPEAHAPAPEAIADLTAELLCLSFHLEHAHKEAPQESADAPSSLAAALAADAGTIGALHTPLHQDDIARTLSHVRQLVDSHGLDLVQTLAVHMKCSRLKHLNWHATPARKRAA